MKEITRDIYVLNDGAIQFPILPNGTGWKSTELDNLSVIESGEKKKLQFKIIDAIENAEEFICLQSFLIQDSVLIDALLNAVERKVKVFVLSSVEARLTASVEEEADFITKDYIQMLETKFKNHFVHRSAENFHGKYILVDPKANARGFICTNNFTENGFSKNPEFGVELNMLQCEELFKIFVYHFWEHSKDEQSELNEFEKVKYASKFILPKLTSILLTSPNSMVNSLNKTLEVAVTNAQKSIVISTFQIDKSSELVQLILKKARNGVEVTLFCRPIEKQFEGQLKELLDAGVQIFFHQFVHAKAMLVDENQGYVFTANLIENGLLKGLEVGLKLNEQQTSDLKKILENYKNDFPFKATKSAYIKDLTEVQVFKEGRLTKKIMLNTTNKDEKRKITWVSDLISFFNYKPEINDNSIKSLRFKLIADIEPLPKDYKINAFYKFEVIENVEPKEKNTQIVVINDNFSTNDIGELSSYSALKIYYYNS